MRSDAALASLRAAAGKCTRNRVGFSKQQRADGMAIVDELRALFASPGTPVCPAAVPCPSLLEVLPPELLIAVICRLDNQSLVCFAFTCRLMYSDRPRPITPVEEALRQCATKRNNLIPRSPPARFNGWVPFLLRRDGLVGKHSSAALSFYRSVFIDSDGRLLQYIEGGCPTLRFVSTRDVQFHAVSSSDFISLSLSEDGDVYSWGLADDSRVDDSPQIVPGLQAMRVSKIATGDQHCAALTDDGALYTWSGWEKGPAPKGLGYEIEEDHFAAMTPRRVQVALDGVRLRCVASGSDHTLVPGAP
jgi:hypothetical protein